MTVAEMVAPSGVQQLSKLAGSAVNKVKGVVGLSDSESSAAQTDLAATAATTDTGNVISGDTPLPGTPTNNKEFNETLKRFRDSLSINPVAKTSLVAIVYESIDAEFSAVVANAFADEYIKSVLDRRQALKDEVSAWMDGRITEMAARLAESEQVLQAFKEANGLLDFNGGVGRLNEEELLRTSTELADARSVLASSAEMFRTIQQYKNSSPELLETLPAVQSDILVRSVKTEFGRAQRDLSELRNRYGSRHPRIIDAESRLASLRTTLDGHIERIVATLENDYRLAQQRVASLQSTLSEGKQNIQLIGQQKIRLETLEREVVTNRDQYDNLLSRMSETRSTDGLDEANATVAESAWVPTAPVKPKKVIIVMTALFFSLLLATALALLIEYLDDTVNTAEDIERRLKTKLLGVLPLVNRKFFDRKKDLPLTPYEIVEESETFAEAVNTCRTALSVKKDDRPQVILITSSVPDEGKSTVALNLAYSFGQMERTLLIDCDLRRPSIGKALGVTEVGVGLAGYLKKDIFSKLNVRRNVMDSFDCVTSGELPDKPLEMLSSAKFSQLVNRLRKHYDRIIIDSAPIHVVSDAMVLSRVADEVLYVVRPHKTSIKLIGNGLARLSEVGASIAGICVSQVEEEHLQPNGGFEFHGFGVDYHNYGKHYRYNEKPAVKPTMFNKQAKNDPQSAPNKNHPLDNSSGGGVEVIG
jgi:capsular exopolysaccharide synthesis family protein